MCWKMKILISILLSCAYSRVANAACENTQDVCGIERTEDDTQIIYFLSVLPYPNPDPSLQPSFDEGPTLQIVAELAVERINNVSDILPGYTLELLLGDGGCQIWSKALHTLFGDVLENDRQMVGIVGPGCSTSATTVAPLIGRSATSLLNIHIAGSPLLADRSKFPYSFSTLDSTEAFAEATIALMMNKGWNRVAVLFDPGRLFYFSTVSVLEQRIRDMPGYELSISSAVTQFAYPLDDIIGMNLRVIFLFLGSDLLSQVFCIAFHENIVFPVYQLVFVSRVIEEILPTSFVYSGVNYTCNAEQLDIATNNSLIIHYQLRPEDRYSRTDTGLSREEFEFEYQKRIDAYNNANSDNNSYSDRITQSFWRGCFYDAVWSLALALNNSMDEVELSQYRFGQREATDVIRNELLQLKFNGLSGRVQYNAENGFITRNIDIYQVTNSAMEVVGFYDNIELNSTGIVDVRNATFIEGSFELQTVNIVLPLAVSVVFIVITVVGFVSVTIVDILTIIWRNHRSVKASSPKLNQLCFIGCYSIVLALLSYVCVDGFVLDPTIRCNLLLAVNASTHIGMTLVFGTVCARTWRLYRIYIHFTNPGRWISDCVLFTFVLCLVSIDAVVVILWATLDPFVGFTLQTTNIIEMGNSYILKQIIEPTCLAEYFFIWFGLLAFLNCALMFVAFWLALQTRRIPHKDFRTNGVIYLVYLISAVVLFGIPLFFVLLLVTTNLEISFIVLSTVLNAIVYCTTALLLTPPVWVVCKQKYSHSETRMNTQSIDVL